MNITIDKPDTIAALQRAKNAFLNTAVQLRRAATRGSEDLAQLYEKDAQTIEILLGQIQTHGKGANDETEQRRAS